MGGAGGGCIGHWCPHTSSVDFCEEDYKYSPWVAEVYNALTSLFTISLFPLFGLVYSNPTREWRFTLQYLVMIACGVGSFLLHATLGATWQASDELPMLLLVDLFLFTLLDLPADGTYPLKSWLHAAALKVQPWRPWLPSGLAVFVAFQIMFYWTFQSFYAVFIAHYTSLVLLLIAWSWYFSTTHGLLKSLFSRSMFNYLVVGVVWWLVDMNFCVFLSNNIYKWTGGATFHVLWHFGAALGTYLEILVLVSLRILTVGQGRGQKRHPKINYILAGTIPVIVIEKSKKT